MLNTAALAGLLSHPTYTTIKGRMEDVGIDLTQFMDISPVPRGTGKLRHGLAVEDTVLGGIAFKIKMPPALQQALGTALKTNPDLLAKLRSVTRENRKVFREGGVKDKPHIAIDASMAATTGIGFREITYLPAVDPDRARITRDPSQTDKPSPNAVFSSQFGQSRTRLDITSLHVAVWGNYCTIHIDHAGFTLGAVPGLTGDDVFVSPDTFQHIWVELIQRDILGFSEAFEWYLPNSRNDFSRTGIRVQTNLAPRLRLSFDASYAIRGKRGLSGTVTLSGSFGK